MCAIHCAHAVTWNAVPRAEVSTSDTRIRTCVTPATLLSNNSGGSYRIGIYVCLESWGLYILPPQPLGEACAGGSLPKQSARSLNRSFRGSVVALKSHSGVIQMKYWDSLQKTTLLYWILSHLFLLTNAASRIKQGTERLCSQERSWDLFLWARGSKAFPQRCLRFTFDEVVADVL